MLSRPLFVTAMATLVGILSGCASAPKGGSLSDYVAVGYTNVTTKCGGGYQVYRQPVNGRLLVVAYAASEMRQTFCQSWNRMPESSPITGVRHEEGALQYISQTPAMKGCILVSGIEITQLHSEFVLSCPTAPTSAVKAKG